MQDLDENLKRLRINDPSHLPNIQDIASLFGFCGTAQTCTQVLDFGSDGQVSCRCTVCQTWKDLVSGKSFGMRFYEIFTKELIYQLSSHLISLIGDYGKPLRILEVGAGNGRLTYFLKRELEVLSFDGEASSISIFGTDTGSRGLNDECANMFPVEKMGFDDALTKYEPHVVIVSWMELGQDWTAAFRNCASVQEYILIGEADSGVCGRLCETWGLTHRGRKSRRAPVYEQDGFQRTCLVLPQIGRTDDPWCPRSHSSTQIFRRSASSDSTHLSCKRVARGDCSDVREEPNSDAAAGWSL